MRVVIPKGVQSKVGLAKNALVDIHIATPYGVSPALSIPLVSAGPPTAAGGQESSPRTGRREPGARGAGP